MKPTLAILACALALSGCAAHRVTHAHWDGKVWHCPPGKDTWVDEKEAAAEDAAKKPFDPWHHRDFVYCVPQTRAERRGVQ